MFAAEFDICYRKHFHKDIFLMLGESKVFLSSVSAHNEAQIELEAGN